MSFLDQDAAIAALRGGEIVLLDTDTLPGLHGLATCEQVPRKLQRLKGSAADRPFLLLVASTSEAWSLGDTASARQRELLGTLWPSALTALLRPRPSTPAAWVRQGESIAIRVPADPALRAFLERLGCPLFSTSANRSGQEPSRTLEEASALFPGLPAARLGIAPSGAGSTLLDCTSDPALVLRPGPVLWPGENASFPPLDGQEGRL